MHLDISKVILPSLSCSMFILQHVLCLHCFFKKEELAAARYIIYYHDPDELLEKTEKKSVEKGSLAAVSESLSLALLPPEAIQLVATGHITDVRAEKALVKAEAKELVMDGLRTAAFKVVEDLIAAANEMVGMDTPLDTEVRNNKLNMAQSTFPFYVGFVVFFVEQIL